MAFPRSYTNKQIVLQKRVCIHCKLEKPFNAFCKDITRKTGIENKCKLCKKEYQRSRSEHNNKYRRIHYLQNIEKERKRQTKYAASHKEIVSARSSARRAGIGTATPKWLTKEQKKQIIEIYKNRPPGFHVDHIRPLKGKNESGLHVPWNLQYLPALDNLRKFNK